MVTDEREFAARVEAVLRRFMVQNGQTAPEQLPAIAQRLWMLVNKRGLPRPLAVHERGEPGGMSDEECAPLVSAVIDPAESLLLVEAVRQLVKACFYPEFKTCRDSFREVKPDGSCRRQELSRVLRRVSGTHCVDCPHWVALTPEQHEKFLGRNWRAGDAELRAHRDVYLPEDFRELRLWLYHAARRGMARP